MGKKKKRKHSSDGPASPAGGSGTALAEKAFGGGSGPPAIPAPVLPTINAANYLELARFVRGWVYAAVRPIAQRIAGQPVRVGRRVRPSSRPVRRAKATLPHAGPPWLSASEVEQDPSHPLLDALANPNDYLVSQSLMHLTAWSLETAGVAYWWVDEAPDGRTTVWYLAPHWVTPEHDEDTPIASYTVRVDGSLEEFSLPPEAVIRFHQPDPFDPFFGAISPLIAGLQAADTDHALQESQRRTFHQGQNPGLALIVGRLPETNGIANSDQRPVLTKEQRNSLITAVKAQYRGFQNHGEPLILDGLIQDAKKLNNTPAEMDYLEGGQATKDRIFQAFGTNAIVAGQIEGSNRASATVAGEHFCDYTVNPLLVLISQTMTEFFRAYYADPDLVVWVEPARTKDPDARRADLDQLIRAGAIRVNELRAEHGMDPDPEGDGWVKAAGIGTSAALNPPQEGGAGGNPARTFRLAR